MASNAWMIPVARRVLWDFSNRVQEKWNRFETRTFVLVSLAFQVVLISCGSLRKRSSSWLITFTLWIAYLSADWVAIYALGVLSNSQGNSNCGGPGKNHAPSPSAPDPNDELLAFWAPFLLLHLGGPDSITSFSLEDNALWLRHGLGLIFQVGLAIYIFMRSLPHQSLWPAGLLMFIAGILKYGERTYALYHASMDGLKNSLITDPDPGPDYAKLMEEYDSKLKAGLPAKIIIEQEPDVSIPSNSLLDAAKPEDTSATSAVLEKSKDLLYKAYGFFATFKRLIVDLILTFHDRNESQSYFNTLNYKEAFHVIEVELNFLYDVLYTKAAVAHTFQGRILRIICTCSIVAALFLFSRSEKHGYHHVDVAITYTLLYGAMALDFISIIVLFFSDWTIVAMKERKYLSWLQGLAFKTLTKVYDKRQRWSNRMGQYNLIEFCLCDSTTISAKILKCINLKQWVDTLRYTEHMTVPEELKKFIFSELSNRSRNAMESKSYKLFCSFRGEWALERNGYLSNLSWSVEKEFDESLLLWHIATELCLYSDSELIKGDLKLAETAKMCRVSSEYLMYILVAQPFMLSSTAGIGQIRCGDTWAEAQNLFRRGGDKNWACKKLTDAKADVDPIAVKGDRSKSVLWDSRRLAHKLKELEDKKWKVMSEVWLEMLSFAASHCRGNFHAKRLSEGGELLTFVWFLMAHLGLGEQYRVEAGHARAKLIVEK